MWLENGFVLNLVRFTRYSTSLFIYLINIHDVNSYLHQKKMSPMKAVLWLKRPTTIKQTFELLFFFIYLFIYEYGALSTF